MYDGTRSAVDQLRVGRYRGGSLAVHAVSHERVRKPRTGRAILAVVGAAAVGARKHVVPHPRRSVEHALETAFAEASRGGRPESRHCTGAVDGPACTAWWRERRVHVRTCAGHW